MFSVEKYVTFTKNLTDIFALLYNNFIVFHFFK